MFPSLFLLQRNRKPNLHLKHLNLLRLLKRQIYLNPLLPCPFLPERKV